MEKNKKNEKIDVKKILNSIWKYTKKYSIISYIAIGITLFFLSMMLVAQIKTVNTTTEVTQGRREAELKDELINLQQKYDTLKSNYDDKTKIISEYQNNASNNDTLIAAMKEQLKELDIISGTKNVKGEGIVVTLTDGTKVVDPELRDNALVHDSDVLTVVNELKAAGAEAISVNGQRIISTSAIRCVGPVIQINYQKVAAPFVIRAIGNAQYLESAMNVKNGVADMLKATGVGVKITREKDILIDKFDGTFDFKNATVAE